MKLGAGGLGEKGESGMMTVKETVSLVPLLVEIFPVHLVDKKAKEMAVVLTKRRATLAGEGGSP